MDSSQPPPAVTETAASLERDLPALHEVTVKTFEANLIPKGFGGDRGPAAGPPSQSE